MLSVHIASWDEKPRIQASLEQIHGAQNAPFSFMRLRGRQWQRIRELVMRRDSGMCQECKRQGRLVVGAEVDHICGLAQSGTNELDNLQLLCADCHATKTAIENGKQRRPMIGADGWPIT